MGEKEGIKMVNMEGTPFHVITVENSWILRDESMRLDALFYSQDIVESKILIEKLRQEGIRIERLGADNLTKKNFWPGRFKRKYVPKSMGKPFLMPSEVFLFFPRARKFIIDFPEEVNIEPNWILITRSGSVGRTIISNSFLSDFVISDDIIRVVPTDKDVLGYIYAFLNTWIGQALLTKSRYGKTVKHIEPHHVANIPIPLLPESDIKEINKKILEAHKLREEAQKLLVKAEEMFYVELDLPKIEEEDVEYFGNENGKIVKAFIVKASELDLRVDASYYLPIFRKIRSLLKEKQGIFQLKKLNDERVFQRIFTPPRFKRAYVKDPRNGIPLLQGSHAPLIKYFDIKYLWKKMKNLDEYIVKEGWILITCSGTIGRILLVTDYLNGWAATNHMTRVIPSETMNPGYLTIFLYSIYGQYQLKALSYGAVVEEIGEAGELLNDILVPIPYDDKIQEKIGNLGIEAYNKKDKANQIESEAVRLLEEKLENMSDVRKF